MKLIHLLRHSYTAEGSPDSERQLTPLGESTCRSMAAKIADAGCSFTNVCVSPAQRAQSTILLMSEALDTRINWSTDEDLYSFDDADLMHWLERRDDALAAVMIVGHNPAISSLAAYLTGEPIAQVPPCTYVRIAADVDHWQALSSRCGRIECVVYPDN